MTTLFYFFQLVVALAIATVLAEPEAEAASSEVHFILGNHEYRYVLDKKEQAVPVVPITPEEPSAAPVAPVASDKLVYAAVPHPVPAYAPVPAVAPVYAAVPHPVPAYAPVAVAAPVVPVPAVVKGAFGPIALPAGYHQSVIDQNLKPVAPVPVEAPKPVVAPVTPVPAGKRFFPQNDSSMWYKQ